MRINEERIYTMYLDVEEFGLMYSITSDVPYSYRHENDEFIVTLTDSDLEELKESLQKEVYRLEYEECNRSEANEIKCLLNDIYYELNY